MKNFLKVLIFLLLVSTTAQAKTPFLADCWAGYYEVKDTYSNQGGAAFQTICETNFKGKVIQGGDSGFVCIAQTYQFVHGDMPGEASNCPAMKPVEQRRWRNRCRQHAEKNLLVGWEIGNRVSDVSPRVENLRCQ